ncbi:MAG: ParB/RepB/Spo0J family partition protein [Bacteriovoracaceae bacterium]|nr:ParB/RepB/Spo0J family partition protein [Bacteriovoracaceae bacterium]
MAQRAALGRGLGALLPSSGEEKKAANREVSAPAIGVPGPEMIDVSTVVRNKNQPRKKFDEKELSELADSIKENGIINPIVVRKLDNKFEIIAGERRFRASKLAGFDKVPVIIKERVTERDVKVWAIIENVQRSDLNCIEEAMAYYDLMKDFKLSQEEIAKKIGKERSTIANFLRILNLPRDVQELMVRDELSFGHAKVLVAVKEKEKCSRFAALAVSKKLSVRELEKQIKSKRTVSKEADSSFFGDKIDQFKGQLEKRTGFHFGIKAKKNGAGEIILKYNNEAEFNDIYEFLLKK